MWPDKPVNPGGIPPRDPAAESFQEQRERIMDDPERRANIEREKEAIEPPSVSGEWCERCEGDGSYSELAPCTTCGTDCACNGPRVIVDPCPACDGTGRVNDDA